MLLIVLWWLALLMFLATQIAAGTRTALAISANMRGSAVTEAQADGAVHEAIFQILAQQWKADGAIHVIAGPEAVTEVRIEDEGEKIDPNVAPAALMGALLRECGAAPKAAAELAAAIIEWRSLDMLRSDSGALALRYRSAGLRYAPPHARFASVDELGLVLGMNAAFLACLEPHLSLFSLSVPSPQTTADPVVRRALAETYPYEAPPAGNDVRQVPVIRVTALSERAAGGRFRRVAVVRVIPAEPDPEFVYKVLSWEGSSG